jgi:hypothetical protein
MQSRLEAATEEAVTEEAVRKEAAKDRSYYRQKLPGVEVGTAEKKLRWG